MRVGYQKKDFSIYWHCWWAHSVIVSSSHLFSIKWHDVILLTPLAESTVGGSVWCRRFRS
jgi:hypothetical protein